SITHTDGYAAAVIAEHARVGSLGLDSERIEDVATALWPQICTPAELEQFAHWPVPERARAMALCFVAKEAFYKAQFAVCAERLGFHDVRIELREAALPGGEFRVHALRALRLQTVRLGRARSAGARDGLEGAGPWMGRFRCH